MRASGIELREGRRVLSESGGDGGVGGVGPVAWFERKSIGTMIDGVVAEEVWAFTCWAQTILV